MYESTRHLHNTMFKLLLSSLKFSKKVVVGISCFIFCYLILQKCDASNSGTLEGSEIKHFYDLLTHREEIDVIYGKYASTNGQMSSGDLLNFLQKEQREPVSLEYAKKLIEKYEVDETGKHTSITRRIHQITVTFKDINSCINRIH